MTHFITREDLLQWLERNCTRKAVVRALQEGTVEHLGAFTKLGPNSNPGWIVKIISEIGRAWSVEIVAEKKRYSIYINAGLSRIPWEYWDGGLLDRKIFDGDNPEKYARLRDERRAEITKTNRTSKSTESEPKSEGEGA